jgi:methyl-accepting chemotaxis protein
MSLLKSFSNLSIKLKLLVFASAITIIPLTALELININAEIKLAKHEEEVKLETANYLKEEEIAEFFRNLKSLVLSHSDSMEVIHAAEEFSQAFEEIISTDVPVKGPAKESYYREQLSKTAESSNVDLSKWLNISETAEKLQNMYIFSNLYPRGEKDKLKRSSFDTTYDKVHKLYHHDFHKYSDEFHFKDIYIVDKEGNVVYSVYKSIG